VQQLSHLSSKTTYLLLFNKRLSPHKPIVNVCHFRKKSMLFNSDLNYFLQVAFSSSFFWSFSCLILSFRRCRIGRPCHLCRTDRPCYACIEPFYEQNQKPLTIQPFHGFESSFLMTQYISVRKEFGLFWPNRKYISGKRTHYPLDEQFS